MAVQDQLSTVQSGSRYAPAHGARTNVPSAWRWAHSALSWSLHTADGDVDGDVDGAFVGAGVGGDGAFVGTGVGNEVGEGVGNEVGASLDIYERSFVVVIKQTLSDLSLINIRR